MLFGDLYTVLSGIMPAQRVELFMDAYRSLQLQYGDIVEGKTIDLVNLTKDHDQFNRLYIINDVTIQYLVDALSSFGVTVREQYRNGDYLKSIIALLKGLQELDEYEDLQVLYDIFTQDNESDELKLAEGIAEFSDCTTEEFLEIIDKIQESLVPRIVEVLETKIRNQNNPNDSENTPTISEGLKRFINDKRYKTINQNILDALSTNPYKLSLQSVLRLYGNSIADDKNPETWVFVLLVTRNNGLGELWSIWDKYFLEETTLMDMRIKVEKLYNEYNSEEN